MEKQGTVSNSRDEFRSTLLTTAKELTTAPGCYLMKDEGGVILYVGKAKNLKNRVTSYFQPVVHEIGRIELLVQRIRSFETILTETESEALILECTLIKKHKPKFNIRLKDDKTYPYLKIRMDESAPRIEWTRRVLRDGARYFGPFPSSYSARTVLGLINESFKLRDCSDNTFRHRTRPCILYQMERCSAPCVGIISSEDYRATLQDVTRVLEGKDERLTTDLRSKMQSAAEDENYELAALYRDQLQSLELITATQGVNEAGSGKNRDAVSIARAEGDGHAVVLQVRRGKLIAVRHFHLQNVDATWSDEELLGDFLGQYYLTDSAGSKTGEPPAPVHLSENISEETDAEGRLFLGDGSRATEILLEHVPPDSTLLEQTLGASFLASGPELTPVDRQILNVAQANAKHGLEIARRKNAGHGIQALEEVQEKLQLPKLPHRIECYDISNTQGEDPVASRVCFIDGAPDKNLYRRYQIKTVVGSNDFAMMREVLGRRFARRDDRAEEDLPDLVVVDGGKGQLSQAVAILDELEVQGVAVVGLAKARTESDFQKSEVKSSMERIFIPGRKNPVALMPHTRAYKLLVHVRDEAHRFAITYHRKLRSKRSLRSSDP